MASPYFDDPRPTYRNVEVTRDTSGSEEQFGQAIASRNRSPIARRSNLSVNPTTNEYAYGSQVLGKLGMTDIEQLVGRSMKEGSIGQDAPQGFEPVDDGRFATMLMAARENPTSDLGSLIPNLKSATGAVGSFVGTLMGDNDVQNPWADRPAEHQTEQPWDQQASYDASPFASTGAFGTSVASGLGQLAPAAAATIASGGNPWVGAGVQAVVSGGLQADAAMNTLGETLKNMPDERLISEVPEFSQMIQSGVSPDEARNKLIAHARVKGLGVGVAEGTIEFLVGSKLLRIPFAGDTLGKVGKKVGDAYDKVAGKLSISPERAMGIPAFAQRAATRGAVGGVTEGGLAIGGDYAVNKFAMGEVNQDASYTMGDAIDSFESEAPLGILFGIAGTRGAGGKLRSNDTVKNIIEGDFGQIGKTPPSTELTVRPDGRAGFTMGAGDASPVRRRSSAYYEAPEPPTGPPVQTELDLSQMPADYQGNYQTASQPAESYPRTDTHQQDLTGFAVADRPTAPLLIPRGDVSAFFNDSVIPLIRQREDEKGIGQDASVQTIAPATSLAPAQVISQVQSAFRKGLLTERQMRKIVSAIERMALKPDASVPLQPAPVAPPAAPQEAPVDLAPEPTPEPAAPEVTPEPVAQPQDAPVAPLPVAQAPVVTTKPRRTMPPKVATAVAQGAVESDVNPAVVAPEPLGDLKAQLSAVLNGTKKAMLISLRDAPTDRGKAIVKAAKGVGLQAVRTKKGIVLTKDKKLAARVSGIADNIDDSQMAQVLGYSAAKGATDGTAVEVTDKSGGVIQNELTTTEAAPAVAAEAANKTGGTAKVTTAVEVAKTRAAKLAAETKAPKKASTTEASKASITAALKSGRASMGDVLAALKSAANDVMGKYLDGATVQELGAAVSINDLIDTFEEGTFKDDSSFNSSTFSRALEVTVEKLRASNAPEGENRVGKSQPKSSQQKKLDSLIAHAEKVSDAKRKSTLESPVRSQESTTTSTQKTSGTSKTPSTPTEAQSSQRSRAKKPSASVGTGQNKLSSAIEAMVERVRLKLGANTPTVVTITADELPQHIKDNLPGWETAEGVYDHATGTVYMLSDNLSEDRVETVMAHEIIGHFGVENVVGPAGWSTIMADIRRLRRDPKLSAFFKDVDSRYESLTEQELAQEVLAIVAEKQVDAGIVKRLVRLIQAGLRKLGLNVGEDAILDNLPESIRQALSSARQFVANNDTTARATSDKAPSASATTTAKKKVTFNNEKIEKVASWAEGVVSKVGETEFGAWAVRNFMRTLSLRNLQSMYGDAGPNKGGTVWGENLFRYVNLQMAKGADTERRLHALAHVATHFNALAPKTKDTLRKLMLATQKYDMDPRKALVDHKWLPDGFSGKKVYMEHYAEVKALWDELDSTDNGRVVFDELATANYEQAKEYIGLQIANFEKLHEDKTPIANGGLAADLVNPRLKELKRELEALENGAPNFSMQREGDWIVVVPEISVALGDYATEEEANKGAAEAKAKSPYATVKVKPAGKKFRVTIAERAFYTFESEREAKAAIPDIEKEIREALFENYNDAYPDDPIKAAKLAGEAFDEAWTDQADGEPNVVASLRSEDYAEFTSGKYAPAQLKTFKRMLDNKQLSATAYRQLMEDAIRAMDGSSFAKSRIRRRLVRGMTADKMMEAYGSRFVAMAHALSNAKVSLEESGIQATLNDRQTQRKYQNATGRQPNFVLNQLKLSKEATSAALTGGFSNKAATVIRSASTFLNLALSPAFIMMNLTQPHVVGVPWLQSKTLNGKQITAGEAIAAVLKATGNIDGHAAIGQEVWDGIKSDLAGLQGKPSSAEQYSAESIANLMDVWTKGLPPAQAAELVSIFKSLDNQGTLALSYTDSIYDAMNTGKAMDKWTRASRMAMAGAKLTEIANRFTMARAAYDLGQLKGASASEIADFANQAVYETQGDFTRTNRPEVFNRPWLGTALQFKSYIKLIYDLFARGAVDALSRDPAKRKEGLRMLGGLLTSHATVGGLTGLGPIATAAKFGAVMLGFGQEDDDENYLFNQMELDTQFRKGMQDMLNAGEDPNVLYSLIMNGAGSLINVDASERLAVPKLLDTRYIRVNPDDEVNSAFLSTVGQIVGGAPLSTGMRVAEGFKSIIGGLSDGEYRKVMQGIAKMTPQLLANTIKTADMNARGVVDSSGRDIVGKDSIDFWTSIVNVTGFRTQEVSETQRRRGDFFATKSNFEDRRNELLKAYRRTRGGDRERIRETINEYNETAPKAFRITGESLIRSMKAADSFADNKRDASVKDYLKP